MLRIRAIVFALWLAAPAAIPVSGQTTERDELKYVVIVTRHGVRAPTWTAGQLNEYSAEPWPHWDVKPGELTAHGRLLMKLFGDYYRACFAREGLLTAAGCADSNRIYLRADTGQRTLETGGALAQGLAPGCRLNIESAREGKSDPILNPLEFQIGKPDRSLALAAVMGRVGGHPEDLVDAHRPAFEQLQRILVGGGKAAKTVSDAPVSVVTGKGDHLADITGALRTASTLTENLLLEYTDGRRGAELGWGRLNAENLRQVMTLHAAYVDLARRTPYLARARGSNLLFHVLASLEQAAGGNRVKGAIGPPESRVLILVGHDTNLSNLAGMLQLNWLMNGYLPDETPPGGALVFELRKRGQEPPRIRTYFTAQGLDQMARAESLTPNSPPLRAPVFVPGCSGSRDGFDCSWSAFRSTVNAAIDREFVAF